MRVSEHRVFTYPDKTVTRPGLACRKIPGDPKKHTIYTSLHGKLYRLDAEEDSQGNVLLDNAVPIETNILQYLNIRRLSVTPSGHLAAVINEKAKSGSGIDIVRFEEDEGKLREVDKVQVRGYRRSMIKNYWAIGNSGVYVEVVEGEDKALNIVDGKLLRYTWGSDTGVQLFGLGTEQNFARTVGIYAIDGLDEPVVVVRFNTTKNEAGNTYLEARGGATWNFEGQINTGYTGHYGNRGGVVQVADGSRRATLLLKEKPKHMGGIGAGVTFHDFDLIAGTLGRQQSSLLTQESGRFRGLAHGRFGVIQTLFSIGWVADIKDPENGLGNRPAWNRLDLSLPDELAERLGYDQTIFSVSDGPAEDCFWVVAGNPYGQTNFGTDSLFPPREERIRRVLLVNTKGEVLSSDRMFNCLPTPRPLGPRHWIGLATREHFGREADYRKVLMESAEKLSLKVVSAVDD